MKTIFNFFLLGVFGLTITVPCGFWIYTLLKSDNSPAVSTAERRVLAKAPRFSDSNIYKFPSLFEGYFNDNFAFRSVLLKINQFFSVKILHVSPNPKLVVGKDSSWIFYRAERDGNGHVFDDLQGFVPFSSDELEKIRLQLNAVADYCHRKNIPFLIVIPPNKETIYAEQLPDIFRRAKLTRLDQLNLYSRPLDENVWVDLQPAITEAKKTSPYDLYYRGGTHWNQYGAFFGYVEIMTRLEKLLTGVKPYGFQDFTYTLDKSSSADDWFGFKDSQYFEFKLKPRLPPKGRIIYSKLLTFGDSFLVSIKPFFELHFAKNINYANFGVHQERFFKTIEEEKPNLVIYEVLQRNVMELGHFPPLTSDLAR